jgi:two-component system NtrC family response regulator
MRFNRMSPLRAASIAGRSSHLAERPVQRQSLMAKVLIVDDEPMVCDLLSGVVKSAGHDVAYAFTLGEGLRETAAGRYDVIFLDVQMPDGNGLDFIEQVREASSAPEVIIMTGMGDLDGAELAIKSGAWDYLEKPASIQNMLLPLVRALQYREQKHAGRHKDGVRALNRCGIIGNSAQLRTTLDLLAQAADSDLNVLIQGETGSGKELFALAIHTNSARAHEPFVILDCSALPETLVESTLFGHDRGTMAGADRVHEGLIMQADGGTLFLDEVGDLPPALQKALLRVLQEKRFRQIGGKREIDSNFRLVAATNRDLGRMVEQGLFRNDLLFRLRSFVLDLPPLRKHPDDVKDLALHYVARFCERHGMITKGFSPEFLEALRAYPWPGNVRELINSLETAMIAAHHEPILFPKHLPQAIHIHLVKSSLTRNGAASGSRDDARSQVQESLPPFREYRETLEQQYLQKLMASSAGNIKQACAISGLSRSRLYELMKLHQIVAAKQ